MQAAGQYQIYISIGCNMIQPCQLLPWCQPRELLVARSCCNIEITDTMSTQRICAFCLMKCICQYDQTLHLLNRRMNTHSLVENDYVALLCSWDIRKMVVLILLEPISKFLFVCSGRVNYSRTALDFLSLASAACYVCLSLQML